MTTGVEIEERVVHGSRRWLVALLLLVIAAAALSIAVQRNVFPYYSGDRDEPVYRYQAQMLEEGRVTVPLGQERFFRPWLSGPSDGHLVMAFQPLWPAVLMVADLTTNSMLPAIAFASILGVTGMYAFAIELLRDRRLAVGAAALFGFSPFVLLLGGTYLNYVFGVALGTWMAVATLRAVRQRSAAAAVAAGALFGLALLTRPFDALLYALPLVTYVLMCHLDRRAIQRILGWTIVGALPFVALTLAYNSAVTGAALTFPTSAQSGGTASFGWGRRSLAPEFPPVNFTLLNGFRAFARNICALPSWLLGSYVGIVIAGFGVRRTFRDRPAAVLVTLMTVIFPTAYLAWWAITLTTQGAYTGLGPHYYLPMLVPLSVLTAAGIRDLALRARSGDRKWVIAVAGISVLAVVGTAAFVRPRLDENQFVADVGHDQAGRILAAVQATPGRLLVINEREQHPYVMLTHGVLANRPTLDTRVIYTIDRGAASADLIRTQRHRTAFRTVRTLASGAPLSSIRPRLIRQRVVSAPSIELTSDIRNSGNHKVVIAYGRFGRHRIATVIDRNSHNGDRYRVRWTLSGTTFRMSATAPARSSSTGYPRVKEEQPLPVPRAGRAPRVDLVVGAAFADHPRTRDPDRSELRYYARTHGDEVQVLTAPEDWTRLGAPLSAWLPISTKATIIVRVSGRPPSR